MTSLNTPFSKVITVVFLLLVLGMGNVWGQTPNGTLDFGTTANGTTASTANTGFGGVRVGTGGGGFTIQNSGQSIGSDGELRGIAPTSAAVNSVGITSTEYGTAATTFTISFELHLSGGASGTWHFFAGNGTSFGSAQSAAFTGAEVFTGIQWVFGASSAITTNNRAAGAWSAVSGTPFAQSTSYYVTIIGNNSSSTVNYGASNAYSVAAYKYDLWVNGSLAGNDLGKAQLANSTNINAFRFYGISSTSNVATIALDNIRWYNTCTLPPTHLALVSVPTTGTVGSNLTSFTSEARSGSTSGPVANSFTGAITVGQVSGPGSISGTLGPNAVAGVATYANTQFSSAGTYTISATAAAPIVSAATSGNIVISSASSTVTFNADGGSGTMSNQTASTATNLTANGFTRTGYTFAGWATSSGGTVTYLDNASYSFTADATLYAQWTANTLTVTYNSQLGSAISSGSTTTGGSIASSPGTPTRAGYTFNGWFTAASGGSAISFPYTHGQTANFTLYAQWTANTLTVTYDLQGGTGISNGSTTTGGTIANPGTPTQSGFSFNGWFAAASGGTAISFPYAHGQTANFTLYAQWTASAVCSAPTVANTSVSSVGATVATLSAEVTGLGNTATAITARGVEYATNSALTTPATSSQTGTFAVETFSRSLTGLNANTQYWYRGFATNDCGSPLTGYSHTSSFPTFTTQHNAPTVGAETVVTSGGFTANWTVNNANSAGGAVFTYQLEYSTTSDFSSGVTAITGISSGNTSQAVTGLNPATNYWYRVWVNNAGGNSNYSGVEALTTLNNPTVTLSVDVSSGTEAGATVITATATASAAVIGNQSVTIAASGTNITAGDYAFSSTTITILSGATTGTRTFTIVNDAVVEGTETATLTISSPTSGITLGATTTQNITITDNDFSTVNLTVSASTGTEAAGTVITATATLSATAPTNQTVDIAVTGTGITAGDYTLSGTTVTILAGATTGTVTFTILDDVIIEGSETATLTISNPSSLVTLGTATRTVAITDNDLATVNLSVSANAGSEASATVITATATLNNTAPTNQTVTIAASGTGITAGDYTWSSTTITINAGQLTGTVTFAIVDDAIYEGTETATLTISGPSSLLSIGTATQNIAITDNETAPLWINPITGTNPNTSNPYTTGDVLGYSNFTVSGVGRGSGINGTNANNRYNANSWVTGALGTNDYFYFTLTPDPGYVINFTDFVYTAQASSGTPSISFRSSLDSYVADIGTPSATGSTVDLSGATYQNITSAITFRYYAYNVTSGATYSINDFTFNGTVTVAPPTVNLSVNPTSGSESTPGTTITLTATASAAVTGNQTVNLALSGTANSSDVSAIASTISIANGATTGTTTFTVTDDASNEGAETATFTISSPTLGLILGSTTSVDFNITDNDSPGVNLSINAASGTEAATTSITLTATVASAVVGDQTVNVALSGTGLTATDFTGIDFSTAQTITILNGATTGTRTFAVANDATYECAETATFTISAPTSGLVLGATTTATHAITDNDFPTVNLSINTASGSEAATTSITLTATASAAVIGAQTVSVALTGTGLANADFTGATFPATITIANGATTGTVTFTIVDDASIEGDESATFTISSPSSCVALGATTTQGLTIVENDFPTAPCSELFISEYVEGSSSNKYIEIYNPTSSSISLTAYSLRHYANGASSPTNDVVLSGTIPAYGTVVYQNSSESAYTGTGVDNAAVIFNGDDAVALAKNGVNIDIFGRIGDDPGTAWTLTNTTLDKTLVRNASIQVGVDVNPSGTGPTAFTTLSTQWTQSNIDVVSNLGSHTCDCFVANPVVTLGINISTGSEASSPSITLTATADAAVTGDQTVQVTLSGTGVTNADFTSATFPTNITILGGATTGSITFTIDNDVTVEGGETATFTIGTPSSGLTIGTPSAQNLVILDDDNLTSTESVITSVGGEAATISSLTNGTITTSTEGTQVWQFRLYDGNGSSSDADTKPTIYEQWVIRPSAGNTVPNWSATLDNIKFFQDASGTPILGSFVVSSASISFIPATAITVSDNGFALISMRVTLDNPLAANSDGLNFGFSLVPADVTVETDVLLSSQLGAFTPTSNGTLNVIDIDATLQFISAPSTVGLGDAFTITISAIDANGNIDQDDNTLITLAQNSGTGNLTGENAANLVNGTYTWTGLTYDTEETFQVLASGGSYTSITANINVVDEEFQLFDHFNRADGNSLGVPSSGGSTSWTETEAGDGTKVRIFSNMLMLDNCIASDPSGSSGSTTTERVTFNAETYFETIFDDAGSTLNWLFNMRSNNSNLSGFASSAYAMAFVLGSDQADFTAAGSDGYAVVVGNSGATDNIKLVKFTNGLNLDANVTDIVASNIDINADHASVKVSFDPCSGEWTLYARNDGASFVAPNVTTPAFSGPFTATNTDHSALDLKHFGALWKHNSSCVGNDAFFDNFYIPNSSSASTAAKVWNGSVNANWNTAANWGPCPGVPTNTDDVIIANVATQPIVSATPAATCKDLTVNAGADLTINSGQFLNVYGNVVNNGTANFGAGTLVMEGGATATLAGNVNVANFHVSSPVTLNGTVTVSSIARSEAGGAITANGNLVIESGAQLLHGAGTTNGGGSVSGNIVVRRQGTSSSTKYNYWSTPVAGGTLPGSSGYAYNSSLGTHDFSDDVNPGDPGWQSFGGAMTNGRGYASRGGGLATFTGAANDATITYGVTTSANSMSSLSPGTRFNLSGNPYPSAISANSFISVNGPSGTGRIAGVLYFWDDDNSGGSGYASSDYGVWSGVGSVGGGGNTPNGFISTGQGFHVDAQSSGNISFTNAMRGGTNSQFFRLAEEVPVDRIWINLTGNDLFNQALVVFKDDATELRDVMYDAHKVRSNANIALGAMQANESFTIAAYPTITQARIVPLQTFVAQSGTYTFEADSIDGFEEIAVYLEDLQSGQMHLLSQGTTVTVQMTAQDEFNRFQLWFSPELVTNISQTEEQVSRILSTMNGFQVQMASDVNTIGEFKLYNAMGQIVMVQPLSVANGRSSMVDVSALPMGVYHAEFRSAEGTITAKTIK